MELTILDSILHGTLKPWKFDLQNTRHTAEVIKAAKLQTVVTFKNQVAFLKVLLQDYTSIQTELASSPGETIPVKKLYYHPELPDYIDIPTQYYKLLIDAETVRVFNTLLLQYPKWDQPVDVVYNITVTLNNVKVLTQQAILELSELDAAASLTDPERLTQFVLCYMVPSLTALYFTIQEEFKTQLPQLVIQEDYHLLDLQQPRSTFKVIEMVVLEDIEQNLPEYTEKQEQIAFGFTGEVAKLKLVINQLCFQVQLINEDVTEADELTRLLTSKSFLPGATKIQIGCETKHFRCWIRKGQ